MYCMHYAPLRYQHTDQEQTDNEVRRFKTFFSLEASQVAS